MPTNVVKVVKGRLALLGVFIALFLGNIAAPAFAVPFNGLGNFSKAVTIIDFESFTLGTSQPSTTDVSFRADFPSLPGVQNPNVMVRQASDLGFTEFTGIFESQYYGFGEASFVLQFDGVVKEFGMGIFDPNFTGNILIAYDAFGNELERVTSSTDPEYTTGSPGDIFSTFVGFSRTSADINRIELLSASADVLGIDNVSYTALEEAPNIPEPSTGLVFISSLIGFQYFRRKNRARVKSLGS
jgi:hypothetical protein